MDSAEYINQDTLSLEQLSADFRLFGQKLDYIIEHYPSRVEVTTEIVELLKASEDKTMSRVDKVEARQNTWEDALNKINETFDNTMRGFIDRITGLTVANEATAKTVEKAMGVSTESMTIANKAMELSSQNSVILGSWGSIQTATKSTLDTHSNEFIELRSDVRRIDASQEDTDIRMGVVVSRFNGFEVMLKNMATQADFTHRFVAVLEAKERIRIERWNKIRTWAKNPYVIAVASPIIAWCASRFGLILDDALQISELLQTVIDLLEQVTSSQ